MGARSNIEWTEATWTAIRARNRATGKVGWHCEHATPGCINCYAESLNKPFGTGLPFKPGHRADIDLFLDEKILFQPLRWKRPRMVFVCSMTDLFADFVPDEFIDRVFAMMALSPRHTFQILTKRSARMRELLNSNTTTGRIWSQKTSLWREQKSETISSGLDWPLPNVWLGVSADDQARADERVPDLLATPAAIRFVSAEPLLGPIDFTAIKRTVSPGYFGDALRWYHRPHCDRHLPYPTLDWIIVGGESRPNARPMHPDWPRSIRDQCAAAGTAFFMKQWGEWAPDRPPLFCRVTAKRYSHDTVTFAPDGAKYDATKPDQLLNPAMVTMYRVGKKAGGRLLDGVEHNGFPGALVA